MHTNMQKPIGFVIKGCDFKRDLMQISAGVTIFDGAVPTRIEKIMHWFDFCLKPDQLAHV